MKRRCDSESSRGRLRWGIGRGLILLLVVGLAGCGESSKEPPLPPRDELVDELLDPGLAPEARIDRILAEGRPGNAAAVPALLRVMKDRSQQAFLLEPAPDHPLGYRAVEFKEIGPDVAPMQRVAAICALEAIGTYVALPDLALALDDRHPVVVNHAARALIRLGCRAGLPMLVANLEEKAFASETASRILREISGEDFGFAPDIGYPGKAEATARWRRWLAALPPAAERRLPLEGRSYREGQDSEADRRITFFVDMIGQMQFLYHEQVRTALGRLGAAAIPFLRRGVEGRDISANATTRAGIAQVLARIDHENARDLLRELMRDEHPTVRSRAVLSRGVLAGDRVVEDLGAALADPDDSVRVAAIRALGALGGEGAAAALAAFDPGGDEALDRTRRFASFQASGGRAFREMVLEALVGGDVPTRGAAHAALVAVTGETLGYETIADEPARRAAARRYRELLSR